MKLSEWARENDLTYVTAYRLFKGGKLPVEAIQLETGTILVYPNKKKNNSPSNEVYLYARVSSHEQKEDLERQMERLRMFAYGKGLIIKDEVSEIASGLNSNRTKLNKLLENDMVNTIVVEHRDRLTRFGFELINSVMISQNRRIIVMNDTESNMDLVQDFIDVVTSMCARIYGKRAAKNKAERALRAIEN